jgi:microcin C transport system substrate-binding protein
MLLAAGCKREGGMLKLPSGAPFTIEFLDSSDVLQPHTAPYQQNLRKLGIDARSRIVDAAQYKSRTENFDFDVVTMAFGGSVTPGAELQGVPQLQGGDDGGLAQLCRASPIRSSTR